MTVQNAPVDGGVGYTYFNPKTGHELSAVAGLTYNFENEHTDYQNGIDFHLDAARPGSERRCRHLTLQRQWISVMTGLETHGATVLRAKGFGKSALQKVRQV